METILNPSKPDKWFQRLPTLLDSKIEGSTLHCFSLLKQVTNSFTLSNFNLIDPASRGFNYGVPESDDFLDPMFYVKQQILSTIVCAICIPKYVILFLWIYLSRDVYAFHDIIATERNEVVVTLALSDLPNICTNKQ